MLSRLYTGPRLFCLHSRLILGRAIIGLKPKNMLTIFVEEISNIWLKLQQTAIQQRISCPWYSLVPTCLKPKRRNINKQTFSAERFLNRDIKLKDRELRYLLILSLKSSITNFPIELCRPGVYGYSFMGAEMTYIGMRHVCNAIKGMYLNKRFMDNIRYYLSLRIRSFRNHKSNTLL